MKYEEIVQRLAPCGLDCSRCFNCHDGTIRRSATDLRDALAGFQKRAMSIAKNMYPEMEGYEQFAQVLDVMTRGRCQGCRSGGPQMPFCTARTCFREKGVDFCFECDEYPCSRNRYPELLAKKWSVNNERMKEAGVEAFYEESLQRPRYE